MKKNKYEISLWEDCIVPNSYKETEDDQLKDDKKYHFYSEETEIYSAPIMGSLIKTYQSFPQGEWYQKKKDSSGNEINEYIKAENLNNTDFYYLKENNNYTKVYGETIYRYKNCVWYELDVLEHYEERKICNIGSDSMSAQWRAREPKLVGNINGTNTFTFKMFYSYIDTETGEKKSNPFISQLVNERKVKVKWKNKWYDLIIKSQQEDSNGKSITYTCKDQFINELSKTGFQLEFSNELMNNQGTIQELGERVVEGTDWKIDVANSSIIKQKKEEPIYETYALEDFTSKEGVKINKGDKFYIFYSIFNNQEKDFFQFWYDETQSFIKQDKTSMLLTSGECLSLENIEWVEDKIITETNVEIDGWKIKYGENIIAQLSKAADVSDDYRAERLIRSQKSSIDTLTEKTVLHYGYDINNDGQIDSEDNIIYSYYKTEYPDVLMVQNIITNPSDFNYKDSGWNTSGGIVFVTYPLVDTTVNGEFIPATSYLDMPKKSVFHNSGISNKLSIIANEEKTTGFVKGDKYIFRYKAKEVDNQGNPSSAYEQNGDLKPSIYKSRLNSTSNAYEKVIETNNGKNIEYFSISQSSKNGDWVEYTLKCIKSISYEALSSYSIFIDNTNTSKRRFLQEAQFFKYYIGEAIVQDYDGTKKYYEDSVVLYEDNYYICIRDANEGTISQEKYWKKIGTEKPQIRINPGSYSSESYANEIQTFYAANQKVDSADKLEYMFSGTKDQVGEWLSNEKLIPIYTNNYEKIRSIEAKQSNRFNILQSLAETFQAYIVFNIEHNEETGALIYNNGVPNKTITFLEEVGKETGYGFVYGIDLKTISRTITSDNIASKVIVSANNNQYAENGFCTIARATENYPRSEFILNFDYYVTQGLIEKGQVNKDLYSTTDLIGLGYYYKLHNLNSQYDEIENSLRAKRNELLKQESVLKSLQGENGNSGLVDSTNNEINETKSELCTLAGLTRWNKDKIVAYYNAHTDYTKFRDLYTTYISLTNALTRYVAQKEKLTISVENLKGLIETQEKILNNPDWEEQENGVPGIVQDKEQLDEKFYKKYSRFIQEGTWTSEEYVDDNLYYLDAQSVAYTSSRPQIQYNISVLRLSALDEFRGKEFNLGDISFIEDTEFFGYVNIEGVKTPYKEKVLISEIVSNFESPENDSFKVQNYKTQFEDLFQRITATTQSLQYAQGQYNRAAGSFNSTGEINLTTLQQSLDAASNLAWSAKDESVVIDTTGITVVDITSPNQVVKLSTKGLFFSNDGGKNFSLSINGAGVVVSALQSGLLNTDKIVIGDPANPTFKWDKYGINAFSFDMDEDGNVTQRNSTEFVRFDRFGLYGMMGSNVNSWIPQNVDQVWDNANFSVTWKGFKIKNTYGIGYVSIDSVNDFIVNDGTYNRIKIGNLGDTSNPRYGISIKNDGGNVVMESDDRGGLWLKNRLNISSTEGKGYNIGIGYLDLKDEETLHRTIDVHDKFIVYEDGSVKAKDGYFEGEINATSGYFEGEIKATSGKIGNMSIDAVEQAAYRVKIESSRGTSLKTGEANTTLTARLYEGNSEINTTKLTYQWYQKTEDGLRTIENAITNTYSITDEDFNNNPTVEYICKIEYIGEREE